MPASVRPTSPSLRAIDMLKLCDALDAVRERIARACLRVDRDPRTVRLIAVTKTVDIDRIRELLGCGHFLLGENRVQEALRKLPLIERQAQWHLIGHLQRNKARQAVGAFELIHGVDSKKLAAEIDKRAGMAGIRQPVLIQANLAAEQSKFGAGEKDLAALLESAAAMGNLDLRGLMIIPPLTEKAEYSRKWFSKLRSLRQRESDRLGLPLPELSMGMTDDFEVAVEEGATMVRVGRAIFG
jgi:pyridoxal phosphate enzyme (YggS family)